MKLKRFPNCGSVHRSLDGLLELRAKYGFTEADVKKILVRAPAAHLHNLMYERPTNSMEAKFSLEYGLAVGLLTGNAGLADYLDNVVERAEVTALLPLVEKEYVEKLESDFPTEVHVTLKSGEKVSTKVDMPVGSSANPLSNAQLWEKFEACVNGLLSDQEIDAIRHELEATRQNMNVRSLTGLLTG